MDVSLLSIKSDPNWSDSYEALLEGPYKYLEEQTEGKNLRSLLIQTFNLIFKVPNEELKRLESIINILHLSSLIVDDIEDSSKLRRGKPCSHLIFGIPQAINSSNYMYFIAMGLLNEAFYDDEAKKSKAQSIFVEEMINLHRGQGLDLYWRDSLIPPNETEYLNMVMNKTGGLFRLSIKLLNLLTDNNYVKLIELSNLLGVIYQIKDDYLNLKSDIYNDNKGFCEDITEGKFSFVIIHSINKDPGNKELLNILKLRTNDLELKKYSLNVMERTGSFQYAIDTVVNLKVKAEELIHDIVNEYVTSTDNEGETEREATKSKFLQTLHKLSEL